MAYADRYFKPSSTHSTKDYSWILEKLTPHFKELKNYLNYYYIFLDGGRNSCKTFSIILTFIYDILNFNHSLPYTIFRKTKESCKATVFADFIKACEFLDCMDQFTFDDVDMIIYHKYSKRAIHFKGYNDPKALTSAKGLTHNRLIWSEEAQSMSANEILKITSSIIRFETPVFFSYNRNVPADPIHQHYLTVKNDKTYYNFSTYKDNPLCSQRFINFVETLKVMNYPVYEHEYLGVCGGSYSAFPMLEKTFFKDPNYNPTSSNWFMSLDWGYTDDCVVGFYSEIDGGKEKNKLLKFDEMITNNTNPPEVANMIKSKISNFNPHTYTLAVADPSIFNKGAWGRSVANDFSNEGLDFVEASNDRKSGYLRVRTAIDNERLLIDWSCQYTINCLQNLIMATEPTKINDIDQRVGKDHAYDETRYACMYYNF